MKTELYKTDGFDANAPMPTMNPPTIQTADELRAQLDVSTELIRELAEALRLVREQNERL